MIFVFSVTQFSYILQVCPQFLIELDVTPLISLTIVIRFPVLIGSETSPSFSLLSALYSALPILFAFI